MEKPLFSLQNKSQVVRVPIVAQAPPKAAGAERAPITSQPVQESKQPLLEGKWGQGFYGPQARPGVPVIAAQVSTCFSFPLKGFKILKILGKGAYGTVFEVISDPCRGQVVSDSYKGKAEKVVTTFALKEQVLISELGISPEVLMEADLYSRLQHPNIRSSQQIFIQGDKIYFLLEKGGTTLYHYIKSETCYASGDLLIYFIFQILSGLHYFHRYHLIHADLKPGNILLFADGTLKIIDLGLVKRDLPGLKSSRIQTILWRAPEILASSPYYSTEVDIWSLEVIIFQLVFKRHPFPIPYDYNRNCYSATSLRAKIFEKLGWPERGNPLLNNYISFLVASDPLRFVQNTKFRAQLHPGSPILSLITEEEVKTATFMFGTYKRDQVFKLIESCLQVEPKKRSSAGNLIKNPIFSPYTPKMGTDPNKKVEKVRFESKVESELFSWLELLRMELNFSHTALLMAYDLLERLNALSKEFRALKIYAIVCVAISMKLIDANPESFKFLLRYCEGTTDIQGLIQVETYIVKKLSFLLFSENAITIFKSDPAETYKEVIQQKLKPSILPSEWEDFYS